MLRKLLLTLSFVAGALLLAALGYWNIAPESDQAPLAETENAVDFYVSNARTVQYQPDGKLQYEMTGAKAEHFKSSEVTLVTDPDLHLYRGTEYPWHVRSKQAEVSPDGQRVELIDDVRIARTDAKNRPTVITSSRMTVFPEEEYAQTEQAVRIEAANGVTTANGMKAYLKDSRIHLLSTVRGQHEVR
ncbi:LPS export ABC transporter periplasmic protein LptC [Zestomonas carbonaria]|uniref:Lipopolysaccharide export system protein LptC n=1 Tax=Zestomonas carbonaria TaxID=2762745 RepID=A0A7U7EMG2_9GAMM|nr:LPS export ABC transporter periplasmic protein LptC [Pseudomonas carbonaria]CAD5106790.1 Lipopolysaccharide export system protein LptC [Pseudomonas carbonaria]